MKIKDYLWLLIPLVAIMLIIFSVIFIPAEKYDPGFDPRIENCGPGSTPC